MVCPIVALPTEGVDLNVFLPAYWEERGESPSPRRAWIEIACKVALSCTLIVALPTEGVD